MTPEQMKGVEALMRLRDLKPGDVVTEGHISALEQLIGPALALARTLTPESIVIDCSSGEPRVTENTLGADVVLDGKDLG